MGGIQSHLPTRMWTASREDSEFLAMKIRNYWHARGYTVQTEVYGLTELGETAPSGSHIYSVRSNMLNGFPNPNPKAPVTIPPRWNQPAKQASEHLMVRA